MPFGYGIYPWKDGYCDRLHRNVVPYRRQKRKENTMEGKRCHSRITGLCQVPE